MTWLHTARRLACATVAPCILASCAGPGAALSAAEVPFESLAAVSARLERSGGRMLRLDPARSTVRILVFRGGKAAKVGHNHVLSAPRFEGFVHLAGADLSEARFELRFRLDELEFDNAALRAELGPAYASVLSAESKQGTREHMLGESNMQASRFPVVRVASVEVVGEAPRVAARIRVDLHGRSREMWVPLAIEGLPDHLAVSGSLVLSQSDFGIAPYSVLGGLIAVSDEVVVDFHLAAD